MAESEANDPALKRRQLLSALADGELPSADEPCAAWRDDPAARQAWHRYQLIGDVLRSAELAAAPARDDAFLARLRKRLADEPTVLAPAALVSLSRRRGWLAPAAVAAGFMVVAGVLVVTRLAGPGAGAESGPALAFAPVAAPTQTGGSAGSAFTPVLNSAATDPQWRTVDRKLIRDARLDSYLRAHRGGSAAVPGGAVGRFETVVLER